jgi:hypothetical protein
MDSAATISLRKAKAMSSTDFGSPVPASFIWQDPAQAPDIRVRGSCKRQIIKELMVIRLP